MSLLRVLRLGLIDVGLLGHEGLAEIALDEGADFGERIVGDADRVSTHVGDETDGALGAEFDAFIEALGDHHGALDGHAEFARGILLELGGGERRHRIAAALCPLDGGDGPGGGIQGFDDPLGLLLVIDLQLFAVDAEETGIEGGSLGGVETGVEGPVFLFLELLDLALALDDEAESYGLDASGGETTADFVPQQGRDLEADEAVEDAAGLLGIDQVPIDLAGMGEGLLHGLLGDFVEGDAMDGLRLFFMAAATVGVAAEFFGEMGGNGFAFAVRIGRQIDGVGGAGKLFEVGDYLLLAGDDFVLGGEIIVNIDAETLLGQILNMTERSFYVVTGAEIFLNRLGLSRRLDDNQTFRQMEPLLNLWKLERKLARGEPHGKTGVAGKVSPGGVEAR